MGRLDLIPKSPKYKNVKVKFSGTCNRQVKGKIQCDEQLTFQLVLLYILIR